MSITPGIVAFNPVAFIAQYPAFAAVPTFRGTAAFAAASSLMTVSAVTSGVLNVGDAVFDAAMVAAGATIQSFGSGTGGAGTYNLAGSASATATSDQILVSAALVSNFNLATLYLNNGYGSMVRDAPTRSQLLNLITAHITALLNGTTNAQGQLAPPAGTVGRISSATQGSVSVQTEFRSDSEAAAFWQQTQWGAMFWAATTVYRTMRHVRADLCGAESSWNAWPQ